MTGSVLVPMDGSEVSEAALEYALETFPDADVTVLHVVEVAMPAVSEMGTVVVDETVQRANEQRAESIADRARTVAKDAGFEGELQFVTDAGTPARSIVEYAADVDAIVMGSHGRHGASRLLLGSVAETVVRRAPVPVTIVR